VDRASQLWESLLAHTGLALCFFAIEWKFLVFF
jgi:hypothetical protein